METPPSLPIFDDNNMELGVVHTPVDYGGMASDSCSSDSDDRDDDDDNKFSGIYHH